MREKNNITRNIILIAITFSVIFSYIYIYSNRNIVISNNISDDVTIYYSESVEDMTAYNNQSLSVGLKDLGKTHFQFYNLNPENSNHIYLAFKLDGFKPDSKYDVSVEFKFEDLDNTLEAPININVDILPNLVNEENSEIVYDTSFTLRNKLNIYNDSGTLKAGFEYETDNFNDNYLVIDIYKQDASELNFNLENIKINFKEIYE